MNSFDDLEGVILEPKIVLPILYRQYKSVHDVDLFILGLAEKPIMGILLSLISWSTNLYSRFNTWSHIQL